MKNIMRGCRLIRIAVLPLCLLMSIAAEVRGAGTITASAEHTTLSVGHVTDGIFRITIPDKPTMTTESQFCGHVYCKTPTVAETFAPFENAPFTSGPRPNGITNIVLDASKTGGTFQFCGDRSGTWTETFTVEFFVKKQNKVNGVWVDAGEERVAQADHTVVFTVYDLTLDSPNVIPHNGKRYVPVMLNDDHDCGVEYFVFDSAWCNKYCPGQSHKKGDEHRELEPAWDYLYIGPHVPKKGRPEDDLIPIRLNILPAILQGNIRLSVTAGNDKIRIWTHPHKTDRTQIADLKLSYRTTNLPKDFYVEGIGSGEATIKAEYIPSPQESESKMLPQSATLNVCVVSLIEEQNEPQQKGLPIPKRKIIYPSKLPDPNKPNDPSAAKTAPITFTVKGGENIAKHISWSATDKDGIVRNFSRVGQNISIFYGESNYAIELPENPPEEAAKHRRFTSTVQARVGTLSLTKTIKIAQEKYWGTDVKATIPDRRKEVAGLAMPPNGFSRTELPNFSWWYAKNSQTWFERNFTGISTKQDIIIPINTERLQYAANYKPDMTGNAICLGLTVTGGRFGGTRKVYAIFVMPRAYTLENTGIKHEDLIALVEHECQHVRQHRNVQQKGNWNTIELYFFDAYSKKQAPLAVQFCDFFREFDADVPMLHSDCSWKFMAGACDHFKTHYELAERQYSIELTNNGGNDVNATKAMREILQDAYKNTPFQEMKRKGYDCYIQPPANPNPPVANPTP